MAHDALPEILSAEKIPEILITEIGKALTLKSFAMLVDKPCDLEAALHSGLPASASDAITPFVLAGFQSSMGTSFENLCISGSSDCIGFYRCISFRSCDYLIVVRCIPCKIVGYIH